MNLPKSTYYNAAVMDDEFLQGQINELKQYWGSQPARTLNDICTSIAEVWAKKYGDPAPHMARMGATSYEKVSWSVYGIYHCTPVEYLLEQNGFKSISKGTETYWWPASKYTIREVEHWLNDDFRGTMEDPF